MQLKVLYLDDEAGLCEAFSDTFATPDVTVTTFTSYLDAIASAKSNPPDLMFIDFRLPGTTGDQVAQMLDPQIPKYLVTGDLSVQTKYKFLKVFTKPYDIEEILKVLHHTN